jgi:leucyl aminopeptidase
MKSDMTGSALVYGVIKTLADLNIKKNVIGILPIVENDVDGKATHPGDIVKSYSGKTVEILDTDAEGRLILADAIYYCKHYNPKIIIDIATLTGQVAEIFDSMATGIMSNDTKTIEQFKKIGQIENEKLWDLPMWDEYIEETESTIADLKNINKGDASTINGAAFLINFLPTKTTKWAHLDVAGVSYNLEDTTTRYEGATGESLRTLMNYVINH